MSETPGVVPVRPSGLQYTGVPPALSTIPKSVKKTFKLDTVGVDPCGQSTKKFSGFRSLWDNFATDKAFRLETKLEEVDYNEVITFQDIVS